MHPRTEHQACVDDRKTSRISRSQHGWKQKAPAVMSTSGKPAFCVYTVPAPRVLGCQCGGGKIGLPSLSLEADLFGMYSIYRNPLQVQSTEMQTGDVSHMLSAQIWGETGEPRGHPCFSSVLGSSQGFGGPPLTVPTCPPSPLVAANSHSSGKA